MLRRNFIKNSILSVPLVSSLPLCGTNVEPIKIGLAQWSLHRALQSNKIDNLQFAQIAKEKFDITVVEYVNQFFFDKATNKEYLSELKARSKDIGVKTNTINGAWKTNLKVRPEQDWTDLKGRAVVDE